jgi:hypothetical protein
LFENFPISQFVHDPLYYLAASQSWNLKKLCDFETKFENIFDGSSGPKMGLFYEKNGNEKYRDTVPLKGQTLYSTVLFTAIFSCKFIRAAAPFVKNLTKKDQNGTLPTNLE